MGDNRSQAWKERAANVTDHVQVCPLTFALNV
jgi:hypothetical protein